MAINDAELAFSSWQAAEERQRQQDVVLARQFYDGEQQTQLSARVREFLGASADAEFRLNLCRTVINVVEERIILTGVTSSEDARSNTRPVADFAKAAFDANRLHLLASYVHEMALRDGEAFVLVDWNADIGHPRLIPHHRYTDATVHGDNFGCKAHYPDDDTSQPMLYASKRWIERLGQGRTRNRMTLYYPDRVEKYMWAGADWVPYRDESDVDWPLPWVDEAGEPLGIPVIHFLNTPDLRSEHWDSIPVQRSINKALIDLLASADLTAFRFFVALGWVPTTDGQPPKADKSNWLNIQPGQIIGTMKPDAKFAAVDGSDLRPLIDMIQSLIGWLSVITSTPQSRMSFTRQIAAEGTLKEQNEGLFAKIRKRQAAYDAAWSDAFDVARRLANTFGQADLDETVDFIMQWEPVQARDTADERDEWQVKAKLGVPLETIWQEMGYTSAQIQAMKQTDEYRARLAMLQMGLTEANAG